MGDAALASPCSQGKPDAHLDISQRPTLDYTSLRRPVFLQNFIYPNHQFHRQRNREHKVDVWGHSGCRKGSAQSGGPLRPRRALLDINLPPPSLARFLWGRGQDPLPRATSPPPRPPRLAGPGCLGSNSPGHLRLPSQLGECFVNLACQGLWGFPWRALPLSPCLSASEAGVPHLLS